MAQLEAVLRSADTAAGQVEETRRRQEEAEEALRRQEEAAAQLLGRLEAALADCKQMRGQLASAEGKVGLPASPRGSLPHLACAGQSPLAVLLACAGPRAARQGVQVRAVQMLPLTYPASAALLLSRGGTDWRDGI